MKSTGTQSSGDLQWLDKVGRVPEYKWQTHSSLVCIYCPHQFWIKFELWCRVGLGTVTWCIIVMYCHDNCYDMIIISSKRQKWCIFYFQTTYLQPQIQSCLINSSSVRCRCSLKLIWISFHGHIFRAFHMKSPLDGFHKTLMMSQYWFK